MEVELPDCPPGDLPYDPTAAAEENGDSERVIMPPMEGFIEVKGNVSFSFSFLTLFG